MTNPLGGIQHALNSDSAVTLGFAGRKLSLALDALRRFDASPGRAPDRQSLLHAAATALWAYVVQKELMHLTDDEMVNQVFKVPPEVWQRMGQQHAGPRR